MFCYRKHSIFAKKYQIFINENEIRLGEAANKIKYTIYLTHKTIINWSINVKTQQLNGFWLFWKQEQKLFFMDSTNCIKLKQILDGSVVYGNYQTLYEQILNIQGCSYGSIPQLKKARQYISRDQFLCKTIQKCIQYGGEDFYNQIEILKTLDHSNILKLKEVYNSNVNYYFVFDFPQGGSLADLIKSKQLLFEEVRLIIKQLMQTISFIHKKGYVHRNLKPEHIFFKELNNLETILISEFEQGCKLIDSQNKHPICRNHGYIAPEFKSNCYTQKFDIFSCGVILYKMITRKDLFDHESITYDERMMLHLINQSDIDLQYQDLLKMMLQFNPELRANADQCLTVINKISERSITFSKFLDKLYLVNKCMKDEIISVNLIEDMEEDEISEIHDFIQKLPIIQINKRIQISY